MMRMVPRGMTAPKLLRNAALLVIPAITLLVVPGSLVAEPSARHSSVRPSASTRLRPKAPMLRSGIALEISLEDYVQGVSAKGGVVLDRVALEGTVQDLVGTSDPLETILLQDLLAAAPRIRVTWHGMSADLNRNSILFLARRVVGRDFPVREITVGDLLTALPDISLSSQASATVSGESDLLEAFSGQLRKMERFERARTPQSIESHNLQTEYLGVTTMLEQIRRDGSVSGEEAVYDAAFGRLFDQDRADAVPLLDAHRRLQEEVAAADLRSMSLTERIAFRAEARRRAFGEEIAGKLFAQQEAIERYQVDLLAIRSDRGLSDAERADRIAGRQMQMKVELAELGSQSGFVGQDREAVDAELRARYGERFDRMSEEELREARRRIYLERLPAELRESADHIRGRAGR